MIKNYLTIAIRSLRKNYLYTLINVVGMAVGLSGIIVTVLLFHYEFSFDRQYGDMSSVFRINCTKVSENKNQHWGIVPNALGPAVAADLEGVDAYCRYGFNQSFIVQYEDVIHKENIAFSDSNFFRLFDFPVSKGSLSTFQNKNTAIISSSLAHKYFGTNDPVGKTLTLRRENKVFNQFTIGAVLGKTDKNASFQFDLMLPYSNLMDVHGSSDEAWSGSLFSVLYVKLTEGKSPQQFEESIQKYVGIYNVSVEKNQISRLYTVPFFRQKDEARTAYAFVTWGGLPISSLYGSLIMNTLILLIACFNFVNTSLVYTQKRLLEIGIRRTFGGLSAQIFKQFLAENAILCLIAFLLSVQFANWWIGLLNAQWPIEIEYYNLADLRITPYLTVLLIIIALLAGAYPATYASRMSPTRIFRGKIKYIKAGKLSQFLLSWQFAFSFMALFCGVVLIQNANFQKTLDWGFSKDNSLIVPVGGGDEYTKLRNALIKYNQIDEITGTVHNLGYNASLTTIELEGREYEVRVLNSGDSYLPAIGCKLSDGRFFVRDSEYDILNSVLINEKFVKDLKLTDPLNTLVLHDGVRLQVAGVVKDFMPYGLFEPVYPILIRCVPEDAFTNLVCTVSDQKHLPEIMRIAETEWKNLFPHVPFEGFFMSTQAEEAYHTNQGILVQFLITTFFALFLSVTGLYSIVSLKINRKVKEIGIRKVFGASVWHIMLSINLEYAAILLISMVIGSLGGYFFMKQFLSDIFVQYTEIGLISFVISSVVIVLITAITSGQKVYRSSMTNPVYALRNE